MVPHFPVENLISTRHGVSMRRDVVFPRDMGFTRDMSRIFPRDMVFPRDVEFPARLVVALTSEHPGKIHESSYGYTGCNSVKYLV